MNKGFIIFTESELKEELRKAYISGQENEKGMEAGLERNEVEDYVNYRLTLIKKSKDN